MSQIDDIIAVAERYVGIKENPPNSNNVIFNTRYYNGPVNDAKLAWCCAFVWCLFQDIGAPELFYDGKKTASCTTLMNWAKSAGQFHTSGFRRGDFPLFEFDGNRSNAEHIGLIKAVTGNTVVTIEGNTSTSNDANGGMVMERVRANSLIIGVFRPNYEEDDMTFTQEQFEAMYKTMVDKQGKLAPASVLAAEYAAAKAADITDGTRPMAPVTRQEAAVMAYRAKR